jgi:hypothetical protein
MNSIGTLLPGPLSLAAKAELTLSCARAAASGLRGSAGGGQVARGKYGRERAA